MPSALSEPEVRAGARRRRRQAELVIVCTALFAVLVTVAMAVYPGGASFDVTARHYLFFENYLSDLGATHTYSGRPNTGSRVLFTTALVAVGVSLALFGPAWRAWATRGGSAVLGAVASGSAALGGCLFIAVAFTPWDEDYSTHTGLVRAAFALVFVFIACLTGIQVRNHAPLAWVAANVVSGVVLASYVAVTLFGPDSGTRHGLRLQVSTQKGFVVATMLNLGLQGWGVRRSTRGGWEYGRRSAAPRTDLMHEATGEYERERPLH